MSELLKTPFYQMHLAAAAKMVPFAGYEMPVQYPAGIKSEHLHTRKASGLFDVSHMGQALFSGESAQRDLERMLPLDLQELAQGRSVYAFLPREDGGIVDDLILTCWGKNRYFVVFNAGCKEKDIAHFQQHISAGTELQILDQRALLALQGPKAAEVLGSIAPEVQQLVFMSGADISISGVACYVTRSGYTGEDGFELSIPSAQAEAVAKALLAIDEVIWVGLGARDSLRLEAGLCLYGHDMDESRSPVEAGLMWSISRSRRSDGSRAGNFVGAEPIFALQSSGAKQQRVGFLIDGKAPVREGAEIVDANGVNIGQITSGGFSPTLSAPIAMGYVNADFAAQGSEVFAVVRDKPRSMTVAKMPFVAQHYFRG